MDYGHIETDETHAQVDVNRKRSVEDLPKIIVWNIAIWLWHLFHFVLGHAVANTLDFVLIPYFEITGRFYVVLYPIVRVILFVMQKLYIGYAKNLASLRKLVHDPTFEAKRYKKKKHWEVNPDQLGPDKEALSLCSHLIRKLGYNAEEHSVVTPDGYALTVHRLVPVEGSPHSELSSRKTPVLFWHALLMSADEWILQDTMDKCLPCQLVEAGYDVWLANARGGVYSQRHLVHLASDDNFWHYSADEIALYDVPQTIKYILSQNGSKKLVYIGHSQGTAIGFMSCSVNAEIRDSIAAFVALAPAVSPARMKWSIIDRIVRLPAEYIQLMFGTGQIFPSLQHVAVAVGNRNLASIMKWFLLYLFRWESSTIAKPIDMIPHLFSGGSSRNVIHWFQMYSRSGLYRFDFGTRGNVERYGSKKPPMYDLSGLEFPIILVHGNRDTIPSLPTTLEVLPKENTHLLVIDHWEHLDHVFGRDVDTQMFPFLFQKLGDLLNDDNLKSKAAELNGEIVI